MEKFIINIHPRLLTAIYNIITLPTAKNTQIDGIAALLPPAYVRNCCWSCKIRPKGRLSHMNPGQRYGLRTYHLCFSNEDIRSTNNISFLPPSFLTTFNLFHARASSACPTRSYTLYLSPATSHSSWPFIYRRRAQPCSRTLFGSMQILSVVRTAS